MEAILNSSFDWSGIRQPYILATENDALNGVSMLFGHLLTGTAQIFADVRTFWSPAAVQRVSEYTLTGRAADGFLHLINSGPAALDATGQQEIDGRPAMKPHWLITPKKSSAACRRLPGTLVTPAISAAAVGLPAFARVGHAGYHVPPEPGQGLGSRLQIAEGYTIDLPDQVHTILDERTDPTWPTTCSFPTLRQWSYSRCLYRDE